VSTVNDLLAGLGSMFPAASVARTSTVWPPSDSAGVVAGEVQEANAPKSTAHPNVEPPSLDEKVNVGVESLVVPVGPESIVV
jgi:hypothetical protein